MLKSWLKLIFIIMIIFSGIKVDALLTSDADELIDVNKKVSIKLNYHYDDLEFDNVLVKGYYIASLSSDLQYELMEQYTNYKIVVNGLKTQLEWDMLRDTLISCIKIDEIKEDFKGVVLDNIFSLSNLPVGLYLIETAVIVNDNYTLKFSPFLINLPELMEDGNWNYDVFVYPKAFSYVPKYEDITYILMKQWRDNGKNRPESVKIGIYKDSVLVEDVILSSNNNWTYKWMGLDDGSNWYVLEYDVANDYKMSISRNENTFIVLNTETSYEEENPKTGDNIGLYLFLFSGSLISLLFVTICLFKRKKV